MIGLSFIRLNKVCHILQVKEVLVRVSSRGAEEKGSCVWQDIAVAVSYGLRHADAILVIHRYVVVGVSVRWRWVGVAYLHGSRYYGF
jgi:hypothetical protein